MEGREKARSEGSSSPPSPEDDEASNARLSLKQEELLSPCSEASASSYADSHQPTSENAVVARKWTRAGLYVFPCCNTTKKPKARDWRNPEKHGSAWKAHWARNPGHMPGLDCEHAGAVVVDCDCREDRDGEANFRALCQRERVDLSCVPVVRTPSGGRHYYFRQPDGDRIANSAGELGIGIDVRGDGGFVVVPGACRADGRAYVAEHPGGLDAFILVVAQGKLPVLPDPLYSLIKLRKSRAANILAFPQPATIGLNDELVAGIKARWDLPDACARIASSPVGCRNTTLNKEAFIAGLRVAAEALDPAEAAEQLKQSARRVGLSDDEIENTIRWAFRRAAASGHRPTGTLASSAALPWERLANHSLKRSFKNAILSLQVLRIQAKRNTFSDKIFLSNMQNSTTLPPDHVGPLTDNAVNLVRKMVQDGVGYDPGKEMLLDGIKAIAEEARFNPVEDWLASLHWDGTRRLYDWLPRVTGAPDTRLYRKVGAALILTMVMRARFPGSKADLCLVLEGEQGCGKSSLLRSLASAPGEGYFADAPGLVAMDNKSRAEIIAGKWLVELAELSGLARSETEGVKACLSQCSDQYRPPYAAVAIDRPRTCIFVATTNAQTYLPDATGNRRFLPIPCSKINLKMIRAERDQLFAQAQAIVDRVIREALACGEILPGQALPQDLARKFALPPSLWSDAAALAEDRRVVDPVEEALPGVVSDIKSSSQGLLSVLPDGRTFIPTAVLLSFLRNHVNRQVSPHGLPGWMEKLGWSRAKKKGGGVPETRGYAK